MNEIELNVEMTAENTEENLFGGELAGSCCTCCECGTSGTSSTGTPWVGPAC